MPSHHHTFHFVTHPSNKDAYLVTHPRDLSLARCIDETNAVNIAFNGISEFFLSFKKLNNPGQFINDWNFALYHDYILWVYAVRITREKGDNYRLSLLSTGSHLRYKEKKGPSNNLPGLAAPSISRVELCTRDKNFKIVDRYFFDPPYTGTLLFTKQQLIDLKVDESHIMLELTMTVPRSYFSLASIIDLDAQVTVPAFARATVEAILCGMNPRDWDWEITANCKCARSNRKNCKLPVYYVHKDKFTTTSSPIQKALCGRAQNQVKLLKGGKRGNVMILNNDGLKLAMYIAYGVDVPLPERGKTAKEIFTGLNDLFGCHLLNVVVPQWEREICNKALALDKVDLSSSMPELLHLLNLIWEAPYGWFPVAKRVAIGVLADMAHLNIRSSVHKWIDESVTPFVGVSGTTPENFGGILTSLCKMMRSVPYTGKRAIRAEEVKEENKSTSEKQESIESGEEEEEERNPCSCTIS